MYSHVILGLKNEHWAQSTRIYTQQLYELVPKHFRKTVITDITIVMMMIIKIKMSEAMHADENNILIPPGAMVLRLLNPN